MQFPVYINFTIDNTKVVLSSESRVYKTEQFVKQTRDLQSIDKFLNKISEGVLQNLIKQNKDLKIDNNIGFIVSTLDNKNKFFFKLGLNFSTKFSFNKIDIIFYKYVSDAKIRSKDRRLNVYINNPSFDVLLKSTNDPVKEFDFSKIYILSNADQVNFPLLNKEQERIVTLEDNNVVVQGVAGSGKTNICIDKIIYAACRRYTGRVLYSTYSHALLEDTKVKIQLFTNNIKDFIQDLKNGNVVYLDLNHKVAIENKLGIWLDVVEDKKFVEKLQSIVDYLDNKVDYFMIEDLYKKYGEQYKAFSDESLFIKEYIKNLKNYNLASQLEKIKYISYELIYKEIYGLIFGWWDGDEEVLTLQEYIDLRKDSFSRSECEVIYAVSVDYLKYLKANNYMDNNMASRFLLKRANTIQKYSSVVLDEVQDFTQINLKLFKALALKIFCVGDVLQMINPTYFSFAYLKRLLFEKDIVNVIELKNNYRNSEKIEGIIDKLSDLNVEQFGNHSFVIRGKSIESDLPTRTIYVNDGNLINRLENNAFSDVTIVVGNQDKKKQIRQLLPKQEILTVSEIKGLERNCIILLDILSDNADKWDSLKRNIINKKKAEENSVYRYYFNLFYVGLSRAKQNLFVVERKQVELFNSYFENNFECMSQKNAIDTLNSIASKQELKDEEIFARIDEFIKLEQYDNARWLLDKLEKEDADRYAQKINIFEGYVRKGDHKGAGIELWRAGLIEEAKDQFRISKDDKLIELVDSCSAKNGDKLGYDIVSFYLDVMKNNVAKDIILDTLKKDINDVKEKQKDIFNKIKKMKRG